MSAGSRSASRDWRALDCAKREMTRTMVRITEFSTGRRLAVFHGDADWAEHCRLEIGRLERLNARATARYQKLRGAGL